MAYKVLKTKTPLYLYDLLHPHIIDYSQVQGMQTRQRPFFSIPQKTSRTLDSAFSVATMISWNNLSEDIREAENLNQFKSRLKKSLLEIA